MPTILHQILITPDGTYLTPHNSYEAHTDNNGKFYSIDDRRNNIITSSNGDERYITITTDTDYLTAREFVDWPMYGPNGETLFVTLANLTDEKLSSILQYTPISDPRYELLADEVLFRNA